MAGFCGCWNSSTAAHCDGCGYKVLLRGALTSSCKVKPPPAPPTVSQPSYLGRKEERSDYKEEESKDVKRTPRRHSLPFHQGPRPPSGETMSQSLQRAKVRRLPMSSAYNVPISSSNYGGLSLSSIVSHGPTSLPYEGPYGTRASRPIAPLPVDAAIAAAAAVDLYKESVLFPYRTGDYLSYGPPSLELPSAYSPITRSPPVPPPFDLTTFIPQLSPRIFPSESESRTFFGTSFPLSASLHIRYQALSLARSASKSHSDLLESPSGALTRCAQPTSSYTSRTLPAPQPPPQNHNRTYVRRPQESNRSQPAIGLKQTQKARPSIFGTVADDRSPRDNTRRGFPQTQKGSKGGYDVDGGHPLPEWAFAQDDDNSLVYEEGVLVSGSLGALVLHATPTPTYYPDAAYLFAFLLSARLFIKPHELLQKICNIGFAQQGLVNEDVNTINKDELGNFVPHMVQLLGEWSETFPYDFRDERMMVGVRTLTHRCIALHPSLRRDVTQVLHNLLNKLTQLERHEESLNKLTVPPPADLLPPVPDITEACPSALILAQQLTHIELERLSYIGPEEFVQAFAKDNLESSYKDLKKTNNLESYVQWFNRLSYLVATQACSPVKKKQRIRVIEMWIEVARECFNIGNFNSLMGVIAGLNMSPVARLKKTWSKVQTAKFSVLEHQMDPSSNFSSYRSTLKAAMWRSAGAVDERQKIVIPFFSLLVKDLYFLNEGCANRLPNGHINFDKFWQLAKQVTEFMAWKQVSCPFEKDPQILHYLQTTPVLSETGLALASFEGEGPENNYEKERFKSLKSETQPAPN